MQKSASYKPEILSLQTAMYPFTKVIIAAELLVSISSTNFLVHVRNTNPHTAGTLTMHFIRRQNAKPTVLSKVFVFFFYIG